MISTLRNAVKVRDLRNRMMFTLAMLVVFRLGAHVPVPGINKEVISHLFKEGTLFAILDLFSGGALKTFSVFAMHIYPYINASIIVQLLTIVIPKWEEMAKEEEGQRHLAQYTRYGTVILGLVQAFSMVMLLKSQGALLHNGVLDIFTIVITLAAGTAFLMWLGEMVTEKGIGNGISLLVFAGIVARLPRDIGNVIQLMSAGRVRPVNAILLTLIAVVVVALIIWVTEGERRIPVQYAKRVVGRKVYGGQSTYIPMKINQAGVIPVIFASSVLAFPSTIASFITAPWARKLEALFSYTKPSYVIAYAFLIMFFTYFYTAVTFNPIEVANNMKKYGGFIPGLRPGKPTADYLTKILTRITLVGAIFLAAVATVPNFMMQLTNIPGVSLGGTAVLIVVGVALETMKQIEAHLLMRHYQGFLK